MERRSGLAPGGSVLLFAESATRGPLQQPERDTRRRSWHDARWRRRPDGGCGSGLGASREAALLVTAMRGEGTAQGRPRRGMRCLRKVAASARAAAVGDVSEGRQDSVVLLGYGVR